MLGYINIFLKLQFRRLFKLFQFYRNDKFQKQYDLKKEKKILKIYFRGRIYIYI